MQRLSWAESFVVDADPRQLVRHHLLQRLAGSAASKPGIVVLLALVASAQRRAARLHTVPIAV